MDQESIAAEGHKSSSHNNQLKPQNELRPPELIEKKIDRVGAGGARVWWAHQQVEDELRRLRQKRQANLRAQKHALISQ